MCQSLTLTPDDRLKLGLLDRACAEEVQRWLNILRPIASLIAGGEPVVATLKRVSRQSGIPFKTLAAKWYGVNGPRGWQALVNRAKFPTERDAGLPVEFKQFVKSLYYNHARNQTGREVHRKVVAMWRAWRAGDLSKAIPGYIVPPEPEYFPPHLPAGWSQSNIARLKPSKYSLRSRREGTKAARELLPHILRTRVGLEFGQCFMIDDQNYDVFINFERNRKAMCPAGFNALEVLSACHFSHVAKPIIYDAENDKRSRLTEKDCIWHTLAWLQEFGYRDDIGSVIIGEMGTASLHAIAHQLASITNDKITVRTSGVIGQALMSGLAFDGQTGGNFRMKSHLESSFALVRTVMAHLRGATGSYHSTGVAPAENHTLTRYNDKVLGWCEQLARTAPERANLLIKPFLTWEEFGQARLILMEMMNRREWHDLEGWAECQFLEPVVRPDLKNPEHYLTFAQVLELPDPADREHYLRLMKAPPYGGIRRMSPRDVFDANRAKLTKLSRRLWPQILPKDFGAEVRVQPNHTFRITSQAPGGGDLIYMGRCVNEHGRGVHLSPGDVVRVYVNPFLPDQAVVCTQGDALIGLAPIIPRTVVTDTAGAMRTHARIEQFRAELDAEARAHAEALATQRQHMITHNEQVMDGEPITEAEQSSAARLRNASRDADAALDASAPDAMPAAVISASDEPQIDPLDQ